MMLNVYGDKHYHTWKTKIHSAIVMLILINDINVFGREVEDIGKWNEFIK